MLASVVSFISLSEQPAIIRTNQTMCVKYKKSQASSKSMSAHMSPIVFQPVLFLFTLKLEAKPARLLATG